MPEPLPSWEERFRLIACAEIHRQPHPYPGIGGKTVSPHMLKSVLMVIALFEGQGVSTRAIGDRCSATAANARIAAMALTGLGVLIRRSGRRCKNRWSVSWDRLREIQISGSPIWRHLDGERASRSRHDARIRDTVVLDDRVADLGARLGFRPTVIVGAIRYGLNPEVVMARQTLACRLREELSLPWAEIGAILGGRTGRSAKKLVEAAKARVAEGAAS